jgi:3-dehydro-L-gulonate-6-phosphate decarboxylase
VTASVNESQAAAPRQLGAFESARSAANAGRKVQVALDLRDLPTALRALRAVTTHVDVIEVGTILCLAEGMRAVQAIRAAYPDHVLLADIRIAEAGALLSRQAFEAGADWVTVVSGAAPDTFAVVADLAGEIGCDVQVELSEGWSWSLVEHCRRLGIRHFIFHRSRDAEARGDLSWLPRDLDAIARVHALGGRVSVTGGLSLAELPRFVDVPAEIFIAGRALYAAADPAQAAADFASAVGALPPLPRS